jgi:hypothetical protein
MDATFKKVAPLSGVVFVILYLASTYIAMKGSPQFAADSADVMAYYDAHAKQVVCGGMIDIVATLFWFLFLGSLRSGMAKAEGGAGRLTATAFGAGVAGGAVGTAGTVLSLMAGIRAQEGTLSSAEATTLFDANNVLAYTATAAVLSAFVVALGVAAIRYGAILPKWLGALSILLGVTFLIPMISWATMMLGLVLVLWASIVLFRDKAGEL